MKVTSRKTFMFFSLFGVFLIVQVSIKYPLDAPCWIICCLFTNQT